jgi:hypothetical protein
MGTISSNRTAEKLVLLVGSNPLPNYIASVVLKPREIVLLYTPETREPCERLVAALKAHVSSIHSEPEPRCIEDATDVRQIRDKCHGLDGYHLHYSGGTKTMAAHARAALKLEDGQASYLDERSGRLLFDDGDYVDLGSRELGLDLDILLKIHGAERFEAKPAVDGGPTDDDAIAMAWYVLTEPGFAKETYDHFKPFDDLEREPQPLTLTEAAGRPWDAPEGLALTVGRIPGCGWTNKRYEKWRNFLSGTWQEMWVAYLVRQLTTANDAVAHNVVCWRSSKQNTFEIDVAVIRGHRLYVISCTTDQDKRLCKSKLFEVALRSRQMGGDLTRSALVCLMEQSPNLDKLRDDIDSVWDAPNKPAVFGLADQQEWAGLHGHPNLSSLKAWLDK